MSLGATAGNAQYAKAIGNSTLEAALSFEETTTAMTQTVYGPPGMFTTTSEETLPPEALVPEGTTPIYTTTDEGDPIKMEGEATIPETTTTIHTTTHTEGTVVMPDITTTMPTTTTSFTTVTVPLYGPPSVLFDQADYYADKVLDARDLTALKRDILKGRTEYQWGQLGDLNGDGVRDKKDIKALIRKLTGKPEDEDEDEDTTTTVTTTTTTTTTTEETDFGETYPQPVYGPPEYFQ
jgi:hypothetical protein